MQGAIDLSMDGLNNSSLSICDLLSQDLSNLEVQKDLFVHLQDTQKLKSQRNSLKVQRDKYADQLEQQMRENSELKLVLSQTEGELLTLRKEKSSLEIDNRTTKGSLSKLRRAMVLISDENAAIKSVTESLTLQLYGSLMLSVIPIINIVFGCYILGRAPTKDSKLL